MSRQRNAAREAGAVWDRFAIAEGFNLYYALWHSGGITARDQDADRGGSEDGTDASIAQQLHHMQFKAAPSSDTPATCNDETFEVYVALVMKWEAEHNYVHGLRDDYRDRYGNGWEQHAPPEIL